MKNFFFHQCYCIAFIASMLLALLKVQAQTCKTAFTIVVLGSSTAAGHGASTYENGWAYKYEDYLKNINSAYVFYNLAVGGATTYAAQRNNYKPPKGRPAPLAGHNITAALNLLPDAIIINYPSNDAVQGYTLKEQENNFKRITAEAEKKNVLLWVATPQPRNNLNAAQVKRQDSLFTWIKAYYGAKSIDFFTGIESNKDSILFKYNSGDGIHPNDLGHDILYQRVAAEKIPDSLCKRSQRIYFVKSKYKYEL